MLLHGLGQDSGEQLEPWQAHLAGEGYDVIYPRYESPPPDPEARNNIVGAVRPGARDARTSERAARPGRAFAGRPARRRGGRLPEAEARDRVLPGADQPAFEPATNLKLIPKTTTSISSSATRTRASAIQRRVELDRRLLSFGFPAARIHGGIVNRAKGFTADHMSVYSLSEAGKRAIWGRTDRLIARALARRGS